MYGLKPVPFKTMSSHADSLARAFQGLTRFVGEDAGLQAADYGFGDQTFDGAS
jgi:hypothetical protein